MSNTPNQNSENRKSQPAQATQSGSGSADKQMGDSSTNKGSSTQTGQNAGQARPAQAQQQTKFTQQHDGAKDNAAPRMDKGGNKTDKNEPQKKDAKAC
ncbi:MAG: hypothetical protein RQ847_09155 [Wenzhouxiangellaceae bacterium]|nr:hypothetical protein [Wenzhouxiangellaceae bacterium]